MRHFEITIKGTTDLILMAPRGEDRQPGAKKDDPDEWKTAIHYDTKAKRPVMPAPNIEKMLYAGASGVKQGKLHLNKLILSGVFVEPDLVPFEGIAGKLDDLPKHPKLYVRRDLVRIPPRTGPQVWKHRLAVKAGWVLTFMVTVHHDEVTESGLRVCLTNGGRFGGLGTWRPRFGRFDLVKIAEVKAVAA